MKSKRIHYARKYRSRKNKEKYVGGEFKLPLGAGNILNEAMQNISPGLDEKAMTMGKYAVTNNGLHNLTKNMDINTVAQAPTTAATVPTATAAVPAASPPTTTIIINTGQVAGPETAGARTVALPYPAALPQPAITEHALESLRTPGYGKLGKSAPLSKVDIESETKAEKIPIITKPIELVEVSTTGTDAAGDLKNAFSNVSNTNQAESTNSIATEKVTNGVEDNAAKGGNRLRSSRRNKKSKSKTHKRKSKLTRRRSNK